MATVYVETSALLSWLLGEPQADEVAALLDGASQVVSSVLTVTEAARGLLRAEQLERLTAAERLQIRGQLERVHPQWMLMEVTAEVRGRAAEPFAVEPVRALDAVHLATALAFRRAYPDLTVLTFDQRVRDNALALGLELPNE